MIISRIFPILYWPFSFFSVKSYSVLHDGDNWSDHDVVLLKLAILVTHHTLDVSMIDKLLWHKATTSQLIKYITEEIPATQKVVVGTEYNMVNRLRPNNTYVLSSTKPECPTMNETTIQDVYDTLKAIENNNIINEIKVDKDVAKYAKIALERMFEV